MDKYTGIIPYRNVTYGQCYKSPLDLAECDTEAAEGASQ